VPDPPDPLLSELRRMAINLAPLRAGFTFLGTGPLAPLVARLTHVLVFVRCLRARVDGPRWSCIRRICQKAGRRRRRGNLCWLKRTDGPYRQAGWQRRLLLVSAFAFKPLRATTQRRWSGTVRTGAHYSDAGHAPDRPVMFAKRADDAVVRWSAVPRPPHWTGPPLRAPSVIFSAKFAASSNLPLIALARFSSTAAIRLKTHIKMLWAAINSAAIRLVSVSISNGSSVLHSTRQIPRSSLRRTASSRPKPWLGGLHGSQISPTFLPRRTIASSCTGTTSRWDANFVQKLRWEER
jgi:hypothetical protein